MQPPVTIALIGFFAAMIVFKLYFNSDFLPKIKSIIALTDFGETLFNAI